MGLLDDEESRRKLMIDADGYRHRGLIDDAQQMSVGATAQTQLPAINVPPEKSGFSKTIGAIGTGLKYALPAFGMIYDQAKRGADDRAEVARMNEGAKQVDGGYEALAEYWAKQGNPEKAKQYMGLANPVLERSNSALSSRVAVNPATGKPELVILMRDGSTQFTGIEPTAKEKSDAGYTEEGLPLTETKPGKLPVGYFWNPITNSAERIPGLPIKPEQQPAATKAGGSASPKPATISELTGLSKSFSQETKDDSDVAGSWRTLHSNAALGTPAGDIAVIYAYMKLQDPTSVVREGEFATAQNAGGIHETIRARLNQAIGTGRLTPQLRSEILGSAKATLNSRRSQFSAKQDRFTKLAKSKGIDPELVIGNPYADLPGFDKPAPRPSVQPPPLSAIQAERDRRKKLRGGK